MEHKLAKLHTLKKITLHDAEIASLRGKLARYVSENPKLEPQSLFERGLNHGFRIVFSSFMFLILIGGSVSAVANSSLPGDPLYAFKLNVNEEIKGLLVSDTSEEKVAWQQQRIENRFKEIRLLAETQTLTKEKQAVVQKALSNHATELATEISTLSVEQPEAALKVTAKLEESLKAEKSALESVMSTEGTEENTLTAAVDAAIATVAKEEDKIIQQELDELEEEILGTEESEAVSDALVPFDAEAEIETDATVNGEVEGEAVDEDGNPINPTEEATDSDED